MFVISTLYSCAPPPCFILQLPPPQFPSYFHLSHLHLLYICCFFCASKTYFFFCTLAVPLRVRPSVYCDNLEKAGRDVGGGALGGCLNFEFKEMEKRPEWINVVSCQLMFSYFSLQILAACASDQCGLPRATLLDTDLWHLQPCHAEDGSYTAQLCAASHRCNGRLLLHVPGKRCVADTAAVWKFDKTQK